MQKLFAALLKADLHSVKTDSTNPHFKNKYASLEQVLETVTPALKKVGIGIMQPLTQYEGTPAVKTIIFHAESGEFMDFTYPLVAVAKNDPQGYGSAISYARRYSVLSLLSLGTSEDDDAQKASTRSTAPYRAPQTVTTGPSKAAIISSNLPIPFGSKKGTPTAHLTVKEIQNAIAWAKDKGMFKEWVFEAEILLEKTQFPEGNFSKDPELGF